MYKYKESAVGKTVIDFSDMESVLLHISGHHILNRIHNGNEYEYKIHFYPDAPEELMFTLTIEKMV